MSGMAEFNWQEDLLAQYKVIIYYVGISYTSNWLEVTISILAFLSNFAFSTVLSSSF